MIQPEFLKKVSTGIDYRIAGSNAITDTTLLQVARDYEETHGHKIASINPREIANRFTTGAKVLVTTKYDGEGIFVYFEKNDTPTPQKPEIFAFNAWSGRVRVGLPALDQIAGQLKKEGITKALLRAELYFQGSRNERRFNNADVLRVSFSGADDEINRLNIAVIKILMLDGANWITRDAGENFNKAHQILGENPGNPTGNPIENETPGKNFHTVQGAIVTEKEVEAIFKAAISQGLEGIVVTRLNRPESCKIKPVITVDAVIIGYVEGESGGKHSVRSVLTALTYKESGKDGRQTHFQVFARIFSKMDDATAEKLLPILQARKTPAPLNNAGAIFAITDSDGRPITFVKPEIIVQVEGDELINNKDDGMHLTQLMTFNDGQWTFLKMAECPRLSFPTFGGIREDKTLAGGGARIEQVKEGAILNTEVPKTTKPTIVLRRVWTKTMKGETCVRKLTVINTGGTGTDKFPFVITFTDYSPNRKVPLDNSAQFANTQERADQLAGLYLSDIKKGWDEISQPCQKSNPHSCNG